MPSNYCVSCGIEIPEGRLICPGCEGQTATWYINPDGYYPQCTNCWNEPESGELEDVCPTCGAIMEVKK